MMLHLECFNARGDAEELEAFLRDRALPYWRKRGFRVEAYVTQYGLGEAQFWLTTEMDQMGDLDHWTEMNSGEPEGAKIMKHLIELLDYPRARVVKRIE